MAMAMTWPKRIRINPSSTNFLQYIYGNNQGFFADFTSIGISHRIRAKHEKVYHIIRRSVRLLFILKHRTTHPSLRHSDKKALYADADDITMYSGRTHSSWIILIWQTQTPAGEYYKIYQSLRVTLPWKPIC